MFVKQVSIETQRRNVSIYPLSSAGFKHHLQRCSRVVCNSGFELISEALFLGIPVLTRPLTGQFEQTANAMALRKLELATVTHTFSVLNLDRFVNTALPSQRWIYPDVARAVVDYCISKNPPPLKELAQQRWSLVQRPSTVTLTYPDSDPQHTRLRAA